MHRCGGGVLAQLDGIRKEGGREGGQGERQQKGTEEEDPDKEKKKDANTRGCGNMRKNV